MQATICRASSARDPGGDPVRDLVPRVLEEGTIHVGVLLKERPDAVVEHGDEVELVVDLEGLDAAGDRMRGDGGDREAVDAVAGRGKILPSQPPWPVEEASAGHLGPALPARPA